MPDHPDHFGHIPHADIDELADAIGELLDNPITIEDADHRLIAYSSHGESTDPARWSTIMGRRVPEKVLNRLWRDGVFHQLLTQDDPVHIPAKDEVGLGKRVAIAIRKGSEVLGYIWAQEVNRPFTETDDEILRQAARAAVPRLVQRQGKRKAEEQRRKEFFWELLLGNHGNEGEIRRKAARLAITLPAPYLVAVIEAEKPEREAYLSPLTIHHPWLWVADGPQLVLLVGPPSEDGTDAVRFLASTEEYLMEWLGRAAGASGEAAFVVGYGRPFSAYTDIGKSYRQALQVVQAKRMFPRETERIYGYHDLGIYRFLPQLKKWSEADGYENDRLQRLKEYDRHNHTNLTETLETFLDCSGKANLTASRLHVHINTLGYRLRRIEEIMGVDLEDANQRTALYLDIKMGKLGL